MRLIRTTAHLNGSEVTILTVSPRASGHQIVGELRLPPTTGLVVLNGGTARLRPDLRARIRDVLKEGLARPAFEDNLVLVTGGTNAGIFALLGESLAGWTPSPPCIGVVPSELVTWPGRLRARKDYSEAGEAVPLEPHHSHFVLVRGHSWGDETPVMLQLVAALAAAQPSVAVVINGGSIAKLEVLGHVRQRRQVVVLAGSGRLADDVAAALGHSVNAKDDVMREIVRDGRITVVELDQSPSVLARLIRDRLAVQREEA